MIGSRVNVPMYTPRLPRFGGGGVSTAPKPDAPQPNSTIRTLSGLADLYKAYQQSKNEKQARELEALYRQAQITKLQRPEQPTRTGQIADYMKSLPAGGEEWNRLAGIGSAELPARTEADIMKDLSSIVKPLQASVEGGETEGILRARARQLTKELTDLRGMEVEKTEGTPAVPAKNPWFPFGIGSTEKIPEVPATYKLVPKPTENKQPTPLRPGLESLADEYATGAVRQPKPEIKKGVKSETKINSPVPQLKPYWKDLPDNEKREIVEALKQNPNNLKEILRILKNG